MKNLFLTMLMCITSLTGMAQGSIPDTKKFGKASASADEEQITKLMNTYTKGWMNGDAKVVASTYTKDAEFMNAYGGLEYGRDNIEKFLTSLFKEMGSGNENSENEGGRISIRFLDDDVAVLHTYIRSTRAESRTNEETREVHSTFVINKTVDEDWKIVHHMIMDVRN